MQHLCGSTVVRPNITGILNKPYGVYILEYPHPHHHPPLFVLLLLLLSLASVGIVRVRVSILHFDVWDGWHSVK